MCLCDVDLLDFMQIHAVMVVKVATTCTSDMFFSISNVFMRKAIIKY